MPFNPSLLSLSTVKSFVDRLEKIHHTRKTPLKRTQVQEDVAKMLGFSSYHDLREKLKEEQHLHAAPQAPTMHNVAPENPVAGKDTPPAKQLEAFLKQPKSNQTSVMLRVCNNMARVDDATFVSTTYIDSWVDAICKHPWDHLLKVSRVFTGSVLNRNISNSQQSSEIKEYMLKKLIDMRSSTTEKELSKEEILSLIDVLSCTEYYRLKGEMAEYKLNPELLNTELNLQSTSATHFAAQLAATPLFSENNHKQNLHNMLVVAAQKGDELHLRALMQKTNASDPQGSLSYQQALLETASNGHHACMLLLLKDGASNPEQALVVAAAHGQTNGLKHILPFCSAKAHQQQYKEAIQKAAQHGHAACLVLLLGSVEKETHNAAMMRAVDQNHPQCVQALLNVCDNHHSALVKAKHKTHTHIAHMLQNHIDGAPTVSPKNRPQR